MAKKGNGRELLRQDNDSLRKQFVDCRKLLEEERIKNELLNADKEVFKAMWEAQGSMIRRLHEENKRYEKALKEIDSIEVTTLFVAQIIAKKALSED